LKGLFDMRLSTHQQEAIVATFLDVFGTGEIRLFGSRLDDAKRGGDIDLYVSPDNRSQLAEERITFLARLKRKIGDQKIDLVIASENPLPIDVVAQQEGVVLC
jgi:predicted nucleotidyltransferase